jgi:GGDEF domain-containing protein
MHIESDTSGPIPQSSEHLINSESLSYTPRLSPSILDNPELLAMAAFFSDVGIVITNSGKQVIWVNPGFEQITGYQLSEVLGKLLGPLLQGPESAQHTIEQLNRDLEVTVKERTLALRQANSELEQLCLSDHLTGCLNRRSFFLHWQAMTQLPKRQSHVLLMLMNINKPTALLIAERIRSTVAVNQFVLNTELAVQITVSIGFATITENTPCPTEVLSLADKNLYRAKQAGRNTIVAKAV